MIESNKVNFLEMEKLAGLCDFCWDTSESPGHYKTPKEVARPPQDGLEGLGSCTPNTNPRKKMIISETGPEVGQLPAFLL